MVGTMGLWWGCHNNTRLLTGMRNSSDPFSPFLTALGFLSSFVFDVLSMTGFDVSMRDQ